MLPPVEYRIVRYLNLLGGRSLDRATELLCAFWVLCALWSVLTLAAVILDRKRRVQVAVTETARGGILLRGVGTATNDVSVVTNICSSTPR